MAKQLTAEQIKRMQTALNSVTAEDIASKKRERIESLRKIIKDKDPKKKDLKSLLQTNIQGALASNQLAFMTKGLVNNLICLAAEEGELLSLQVIVEIGASFIDLNFADSEYRTALMHAASRGHLEVVQFLLERGFWVDKLNNAHRTALMLAFLAQINLRNDPSAFPEKEGDAKLGLKPKKNPSKEKPLPQVKDSKQDKLKKYAEICCLLIQKTKDFSTPFPDGSNLLHAALDVQNIEAVKLLLSKAPELLTAYNQKGITPLMHCLQVFPEAFDLLLAQYQKSGFNINLVNADSWSILGYAVTFIEDIQLRYRIIQALLQVGADPRKSLYFYFMVVYSEDDKLLELVMRTDKNQNFSELRGKKNESLLAALLIRKFSRETKVTMLKLLLKTGQFNLEETNELGETLFFQAIVHGEKEIAKALLEAGAKPCVKRKDGTTTLMAAVNNGFDEVLSLILQKTPKPLLKESINAVAEHQLTALQHAVHSGHTACLKLLLESAQDLELDASLCTVNNESIFYLVFKDPDLSSEQRLEGLKLLCQYLPKVLIQKIINVPEKSFEATALYLACQRGEEEAVQLLLEQGADQNIPTKEGTLALHVASSCGFDKVLSILLQPKFRAKVDAACSKTLTALMYAALSDESQCIEVLLDAGANIEATIKGGETALMLATSCGKVKALRTLIKRKANLNASCALGNTAVFYGSSSGQLDCLRLLCEQAHQKPNLDKVNRRNQTPLMVAKNSRTAAYLRSQGVEGFALSCYFSLNFVLLRVSLQGIGKCVEDAEQYIEAIDLTSNQTFEFESEVYHPIILYANNRNVPKVLRIFILKHKLYQNKHDKSSVDQFTEILKAICLNLSFGEENALVLNLAQKDQECSVTLSENSLKLLLEHCKKNQHNVQSRKEMEIFKKIIIQHSEENKALLEEAEVNNLKNEMLNKQMVCNTRLMQLGNDLSTVSSESAAQFKVEYDKLISKMEVLAKESGELIPQSYEKELIRDQIKSKTEEYEKLLNQILELHSSLKKLITQLQEAAQPKHAASQGGSGKSRGKKHKVQPKKKAEAELPQVSLPPLKPVVSSFSTKASELQNQTTQQQEKQSQNTQKSQVKPKAKVFIPPFSQQMTGFQDSKIDAETRHYLRVPKLDFERVSNLGSRLRAQDGLRDLKQAAESLQGQAPLMDLETQLDILRGMLGQAFESRKTLKEKWPDHVRNILFKSKEALRKQYSEEELIKLFKAIIQKIERVATPEYLKATGGRLAIEEIDHQGFLDKVLKEFVVPVFSLERAEAIIAQSKEKIKKLKTQILAQGEAALENESLHHAIGIYWTDQGTYYSEMSDNLVNFKLDKSQNSMILFGNNYRHKDNWKPAVLKFIEKTLESASQKASATQKGLHFKFNPEARAFEPREGKASNLALKT